MLIISRIFLVLIFTITFAGSTWASEVTDILDRIIETYGGEQNLRKMDNMTQQWDFVALTGKRHGTDTRYIRSPGQLRVDLQYPDKSETRILQGSNGRSSFNGSAPVQVTGIQLDAMRLQLMRLYSPLMLKNKVASVGLTENGDLLALTLAENGVHVHYLVNKDNWHIEKVAGVLLMNGHEIQFLTEYSDFKIVDGVLVHHKENKFAQGTNTAMLQLRDINFDVQFEESLFAPENY